MKGNRSQHEETFLNRTMARARRNTASWSPCPAQPGPRHPPRVGPPPQLASPPVPSGPQHAPPEGRGALLLPRRALGLALGITLAGGLPGGSGTLEALQQLIAHGGVASLEAVLLGAGLRVEVHLLVGVLDLRGPDDADRDVLLPLAVGQVIHGLRLRRAGVGGRPALLQPQPNADHGGGAAQEQREDEDHARADGHPGERAGLALRELLGEVHHHGARGQQELAVGAPVASGALAQVAEGPLVAGGPVVAGRVLTPADGGAAVPARVPGGAGAGILIRAVPAGAAVGTRGRGTVVQVVITMPPREAGLAAADVSIAKVYALCTWDTDKGSGLSPRKCPEARAAPAAASHTRAETQGQTGQRPPLKTTYIKHEPTARAGVGLLVELHKLHKKYRLIPPDMHRAKRFACSAAFTFTAIQQRTQFTDEETKA